MDVLLAAVWFLYVNGHRSKLARIGVTAEQIERWQRMREARDAVGVTLRRWVGSHPSGDGGTYIAEYAMDPRRLKYMVRHCPFLLTAAIRLYELYLVKERERERKKG